jgi:hypothetical protein
MENNQDYFGLKMFKVGVIPYSFTILLEQNKNNILSLSLSLSLSHTHTHTHTHMHACAHTRAHAHTLPLFYVDFTKVTST